MAGVTSEGSATSRCHWSGNSKNAWMRAGHQVPGRLVAGDGEEEEEQLELHVGEALAVQLDLGERAHEVAVRVDPLLGEQLAGVAVELHGGLQGIFGGDAVLGVLAADHPVRPVEHVVPLVVGDAEELGDDLEGELGGDLGDEVGLALLADGVDDPVGGPVDALLEVVDHPRREPLVDEPPVAGVQRRVHVQHHQTLLGDLVVGQLERHRALALRREPFEVTVDGHAVVVLRYRPEPRPVRLGLPVDGVVAAEVREVLVRDAGHVRPGVGEVDGGDIDGVSHFGRLLQRIGHVVR